MAEESGIIFIKATPVIHKQLKEKFNTGLLQLANYADISQDKIAKIAGKIDTIKKRGAYLELSYDCDEWVDVSHLIISEGQNIEYYSRHFDEYGTCSFFALTSDAEAFCLSFNEESEEMDFDNTQSRINDKLDTWESLLPQKIKPFLRYTN